MLEKYYIELDLPELPLANLKAIESATWKDLGYFIDTQPHKLLSKSILDKFSELKVAPGYLVFFPNTYAGVPANRHLHKDIVTAQDPRLVRTLAGAAWKPACFGINFEVYGNENLFHWYHESQLKPKALPETTTNTPLFRGWLSGIHFDNPDNVQPVATKAILTKPVLVRTDVPHRTTFEVSHGSPRRLGVSIRFYEDWSWQDALHIFAPVFQK